MNGSEWVCLLTASSRISDYLRFVFSLAKSSGYAWWTKYFPRTCGIEFENNSEFKKGSTIGDCGKDCTGSCSRGEMRYNAVIHSNFDSYNSVPFYFDLENYEYIKTPLRNRTPFWYHHCTGVQLLIPSVLRCTEILTEFSYEACSAC